MVKPVFKGTSFFRPRPLGRGFLSETDFRSYLPCQRPCVVESCIVLSVYLVLLGLDLSCVEIGIGVDLSICDMRI